MKCWQHVLLSYVVFLNGEDLFEPVEPAAMVPETTAPKRLEMIRHM
jgi:hypothetical protein